jgi:signal transduction histidine kinase
MQNIGELLNTIPGAFFFHLTVTLTILGVYVVLTGVNVAWDNRNQLKRLQLGIGALLGLRIVLFLLALLISADLLQAEILPPLERGLGMASIAILVWVWCFPRLSSAADWGARLSVLFFLSITIISVLLWLPESGTQVFFSGHWIDRTLGFLSMLAALAGIAMLVANRPGFWVYGVLQFGILLLAEGLHLLLPAYPSQYALEIRLAQIAAYPLLFALPFRLQSKGATSSETTTSQRVESRQPQERKKFNLPPGMLENILSLQYEKDGKVLFHRITEFVAFSFVGDICFLISWLEDQNKFNIHAGYHLILEQAVSEHNLDVSELPLIQSAFQKKTPLRLHASSTSLDLVNLGNALEVAKTGHLLLVPLETQSSALPMAIGLYSPYSNRNWGVGEQEQLEKIAGIIADMVDMRTREAQNEQDPGNFQTALARANERITLLEGENEALRSESESLKTSESAAYPFPAGQWPDFGPEEITDLEEKVKALEKENQRLLQQQTLQAATDDIGKPDSETAGQLEEQIALLRQDYESVEIEYQQALSLVEELKQQNAGLRQAIDKNEEENLRASENGQQTAGEIEHVEKELEKTLAELARLQKMNGEAEIRILQLENLAKSAHDETRNWEVIISAAEDMRQPMSAIIGYSDFLLSESVGLLGALQKKFLERVKSSTERMNAMVENLIRIASDEAGHIKLSIGMVNINASIDAAIASTQDQIREKNILMRVDIPEELPEIIGDPEAIRLTLVHLLQNAASATPEGQEIAIRASLEDFDRQGEYTLITVSDSGEGIAPEDIPNIFNRKYSSAHRAIEGLGAPGIGLTITKTLIEAHGGRIWVESEDQAGTTFHILLPTSQPAPAGPFETLED